ncbi:MAG: radical SAM protein, partial [Candidatus Omnitrophica bacterium]|nr:radical SAM protein [Candidatus Omnitrophota bacterium]
MNDRLDAYCKELKKGGTEWVVVSGGMEPLADPFTFDILRAARAAGLNTRMVTNGILLSLPPVLRVFDGSLEKAADFILTHVDDLQISLDFSSRDEYLESKNLPLSSNVFDVLIANIRFLVQRKKALISEGYQDAVVAQIGDYSLKTP